MTTAPVMPSPAGPVRASRLPLATAGRLLRVELRRNAMPWMAPLIATLFWLITYRPSMAYPPLWNVRAMTMQTTASAVFVPTVVGVAAWLGSRERRHGVTDLLAGTARPRLARQLATWAATTCWAMVIYLGCVGVLYGVTGRQGAWGGPLWWPAVVGAASLPAFSALGFTAGALRPSRFTAPLVAIAAFLALELSAHFIHGDHSYWQVSPLVAGPWELGPNQDVGTFYHYLPDLPIAQVMFLAGLTAALLGTLGLPAGSGGRWLRRFAAAITTAGLLTACAAVALVGTGRLDTHGMIAIPRLHNAANDRPIRYTPVCSHTPIPVCLHPAYRSYLPAITAALEPVLGELNGLPGAPVRVCQAAVEYRQGPGNEVGLILDHPAADETPSVFYLFLPNQLARSTSTAEFAAQVGTMAARDIVNNVIGGGRSPSPAQQAVAEGILNTSTIAPGTPVAAAARRFAALPAAVRHTWLVDHLAALRAGRITLAELP